MISSRRPPQAGLEVRVAAAGAANADVPPDRAGLAAALITTSFQVGGALGLAIFSVLATTRTHELLGGHVTLAAALTAGFSRALFAASICLVAAALVALRAPSTRGEPVTVTAVPSAEPSGAAQAAGPATATRAQAGPGAPSGP